MFEQIDFPVQPLMDAEIRKGDLNAAYDAIILPADSIAAMTGETPPGGEGGRGGRGGTPGGGREGGTPPQCALRDSDLV
jgi:8-oxo-dGTP pyrophosphatase MutT (NUDIX family)